jgi:phosphoribosylformylglycinamidine (FGAM) synthase-like enzyme
MNPELGKWDPYIMAKNAVDEAYRNALAVGGNLLYAAILDNFCWGNPKSPLEIAGLVRAAEGAKEAALVYGLPFISGKDSFNNTWKTADGKLHSIPPTLLISAIGVLEDVRTCVTPGLKEDGALLYVIGDTTDKTAGSIAAKIGALGSNEAPDVDLTNAKALYKKFQTALKHRLIVSSHDISEGGIAVSVSEMAFGSAKGAELKLAPLNLNPAVALFSETPSRFIVEVLPQHQAEFDQIFGRSATLIGKVTKAPNLVVKNGETVLFQETIATLKPLWKNGIHI